MDTSEIRALIAQKIAGQGSMVDVGGGLPAILNAICDAIEGGGEIDGIVSVPFASNEFLDDWVELRDLPVTWVANAFAIKCSDGVVLSSKMATMGNVEISDEVGVEIYAIFGNCTVSDVLESASLYVFSVQPNTNWARVISYLKGGV